MKKLAIALLSLVCLSATAQNKQGKADDFGRICLTAFISPETDMPQAAQTVLLNKLRQVAVKNGMAGADFKSRFIVTATVNVLTKDITPTAPPMHAYTLNIDFYVGDGVDGTLFSSTSLTVKGVGETEAKAYLAALKNVKVNDPIFKPFLDKGKNRIIEYYNAQCDFILKSAQTAAARDEYDAAILQLLQVPDVCKECYDKCMAETETIFLQKIDRDCQIKLNRARSLWQANQDDATAEEVNAILLEIDPKAPSYDQVRELQNEVFLARIERDCLAKLGQARSAWLAGEDAASAKKANAILATINPKAPSYRKVEALQSEMKETLRREAEEYQQALAAAAAAKQQTAPAATAAQPAQTTATAEEPVTPAPIAIQEPAAPAASEMSVVDAAKKAAAGVVKSNPDSVLSILKGSSDSAGSYSVNWW